MRCHNREIGLGSVRDVRACGRSEAARAGACQVAISGVFRGRFGAALRASRGNFGAFLKASGRLGALLGYLGLL